jgi:hypothetical protein
MLLRVARRRVEGNKGERDMQGIQCVAWKCDVIVRTHEVKNCMGINRVLYSGEGMRM